MLTKPRYWLLFVPLLRWHHHGAACFPSYRADTLQHRADLVCPVHIYVRADIRLKRVEDKQLRVCFGYGLFNPNVGKVNSFSLSSMTITRSQSAPDCTSRGFTVSPGAVLGGLKYDAHRLGGDI